MNQAIIQELWRFPIKSFGGEKLNQVTFAQQGILGDRAYALMNTETGKVISAKSVRQFPNLLCCQAQFLAEPQPGQAIPPVKITLDDGTTLQSDDPAIDQKLSNYFGQALTLAQTAPDDFTIDTFNPDVEGINPEKRGKFTESKLGTAFFERVGQESAVPAGSFMDIYPLSIITSSTLEYLQKLRPESNFDLRRFRMNIILKTSEEGFVENDWLKKEMRIQDSVRIQVTIPDPRCVMTTLAQEGFPRDNQIMKTLSQHNTLDVEDLGKCPCAGVYATILQGGTGKVGDQVAII